MLAAVLLLALAVTMAGWLAHDADQHQARTTPVVHHNVRVIPAPYDQDSDA